MKRWLAIFGFLAVANLPLWQSATPPQKSTQRPPLRVDVDLVLVNVTVLDPAGRLVSGLERENFQVLEDGIAQEVLHLSSEDVPVSVGVVFDVSGSMSGSVNGARQVAVKFFKTANPQDEFFLVLFNDRAQLVTDFTSDINTLQNQLIYKVGARGMTAMYDGIYLALSQLRNAHNARRALLIISDGGENRSRFTPRDVERFLRETDVQIYAVGAVQGYGMALEDLVEKTGGRSFRFADPADIAAKVSLELRSQYVLAYRSSNTSTDGRWRKIKVKMQGLSHLPPLLVYARSGYYAPVR